MSRFIETIKIEDQKAHLIHLHQQRVDATFAHFCKEKTIDLENIFKKLEHDEDGLYKFRIVYDLNGNVTTRMIPYAVSEIHDFQIVVDNEIDYSFKFEDRKIFEILKTKSKASEIIIIKNNLVTDTSFSNILFKRKSEWFTPSSYLLNGVQRQHLLATKKIKEAEITLDNIKEFTHFQLINAMIDMDDTFLYPIDNITNLNSKSSNEDL